METTLTFCADLQGLPADASHAQLKTIHGALTKQGDALQEVAKTFSQTTDRDGGVAAANSPLIAAAMEHTKLASLGSLHLLAAQAEVLTPQEVPAFIDVTLAFLEHCNWHQVTIAPRHLGSVCEKFGQVCISEGRASEALLPLRSAAIKMDGDRSSLTPLHPEFLQCCIAAKCYSLGSRFMDDRPIFGVEPVATGLTPVHFLRHFYYGGIVYIGAKQWKGALDSFLMLLTIPANVLSSLVIEGYKKMMLVSLIISGEVPPLPKYASNSVTRHLKSHTSDYEALVSCFQAGDVKGLNAAVVAGSEKFIQVGLAHADDAQGYILNMVEAGEICAQIAYPAGTVHFREDTNTLSSTTMTARLEADLRSTAELTERVRKLEARLIVNPVFIQKMVGDHSLPGAGLGGAAGYSASWDDIGMGD
ncbi:conserved unknown protein [Ectocarpus siliculosus]|uniref:COP9 signalosome complex subunit 3 N-terminal helical repeats domain-containing protein n=1 Tax=Ectocarpus siliculosus TaxID=2880 RepID=D7G4S3_ECTSI|nr:conserved unknown protein [Ectocarpus siliculosus]|eukprot:CBJ27166.1 conserved unknown protein [Ectocarpus siliculosus]